MTPRANASAASGETLKTFLRAQLAPYPGRLDAVMRFGVCAALVILISLYLQVPFLDLSIIVLFFVVMENTLLTYIAAVLVIAGTLLVAVIDNLFLGLTIDYPVLRVIISSLMVFLGMYLLRAGTIVGAFGYMWSICIIFLQSNMPLLPNGEIMLRLNLWSSMAVIYPTVLAVIVCTLVRPAWPSRMLPEEMIRQLNLIIRLLEEKAQGKAPARLSLDAVEANLTRLHRLLEFAAIEKKDIKNRKAWHLARLTTIDRLSLAAAQLGNLPAGPLSAETIVILGEIKQACLDFIEAVKQDAPFRLREAIVAPDQHQARGEATTGGSTSHFAELKEMRDALDALSASAGVEYPPLTGQKLPMLKPDAFTNPAYPLFGFKTVLATLLCLGFYKTTQWEGIHTCMLTCIIVAQPSIGAVAQKSLLRISGCLIGSLATLLIVIFCMPHIQDITAFILVTLAVLLPAAWVAVGPVRSSYAGMQIAFAYALALLASSGPTFNLTEIRDRLIGILVGAVVSTLIHTLLWPEKEESALRKSMAALLRAAAAILEAGALKNAAERQTALRNAESEAWSLLAKSREIQARAALEPEETKGEIAAVDAWLADAQNMLFTLHGRLAGEAQPDPELAAALRHEADDLLSGAAPAMPELVRLKLLEGPA